jgi:hypothetical protein
MQSLRAVALVGAVLAIALIGAPTAPAATEVGNNCEANIAISDATLLPFANGPTSILPATAPSPGVVTAWKVTSIAGAETFPEKLKVLRPTQSSHVFHIVAESSVENVVAGQNSFPTRIVVKLGDRFGAYGSSGTLGCEPGSFGDIAAAFSGDAALGKIRSVIEEPSFQAAVSATIEPDVDGDGYGDETQDKCPQSAAIQSGCPEVTVTASGAAKERSIVVSVDVSSEATIDVYGQVGWRYRASPKLKTAGGKPKRLIIALSGPQKTVLPGTQVPFRVPLRKAVLRRLDRLTPKASLVARLSVSSTDLAGRIKHHRLNVRLEGRDVASR